MWAFAKRTLILIAVNALILVTTSLVFQIVVGALDLRMTVDQSILIYYAVVGFTGAFVSLALSRQMAKWSMGVRVLDPRSTNTAERRLLDTVHSLARAAGLPRLPEVGVYESDDINAFATGPTKARSLVAVSTGLLERMDYESVTGVLGHEIAHVANGDMVTMTLLQGLLNTMVLVLARILSGLLTSNASERSRPVLRQMLFYALQVPLSLLGSLVVSYFSRRREFRADAGGARLAGRERMLAGLRALRAVYGQPADVAHPAIAALKISGPSTSSLAALFATHPPLEERIRRLESSRG